MNTLPKGSRVIFNGNEHKLVRDIKSGEVPKQEDFNPIIPKGTKIQLFEVYDKNDKCIYRHPNFID